MSITFFSSDSEEAKKACVSSAGSTQGRAAEYYWAVSSFASELFAQMT